MITVTFIYRIKVNLRSKYFIWFLPYSRIYIKKLISIFISQNIWFYARFDICFYNLTFISKRQNSSPSLTSKLFNISCLEYVKNIFSKSPGKKVSIVGVFLSAAVSWLQKISASAWRRSDIIPQFRPRSSSNFLYDPRHFWNNFQFFIFHQASILYVYCSSVAGWQ